MSVKISIVVPVYNASKFLDLCLDSLTNQTLEEIEILAVDDGSSDDSLAILRAHAACDPRIMVVTQENAGESAARNRAFSMAHGEYIGCVDADDWVEPDMFNLMYRRAKEKNADIVLCGWQEHRQDQTVVDHIIDNIPKETLLEGVQYNLHVLPNILLEKIPGYMWNKLIRTSLISDNELKMPLGLHTNPDWVFMCDIFSRAQSVISISAPLYHYRIHSNNSFFGKYRESYFDNILMLHHYRNQYATKWQLVQSAEVRQRILIRFLETISAALLREFLIPHQAALGERVINIRKITTHPEVRSAAAVYDDSDLQHDRRLFDFQVVLINRGNWVLLYLMSWLIAQRIRLIRAYQSRK